jgi:hypothetical protein
MRLGRASPKQSDYRPRRLPRALRVAMLSRWQSPIRNHAFSLLPPRLRASTLVPDAPAAFTSEKGWDLTVDQMQLLRPVIASLRAQKPCYSLHRPRSNSARPSDPSRGRGHRDLHGRLCCGLPRTTTCRHAGRVCRNRAAGKSARPRGKCWTGLEFAQSATTNCAYSVCSRGFDRSRIDCRCASYGSAVRAYVRALTSTQDATGK